MRAEAVDSFIQGRCQAEPTMRVGEPVSRGEEMSLTNHAALEIRGVSKSYRHFVALHPVSLILKQGELLCFLGPSGCGKTTLLRLITGLDQADEGDIWKAGVNISRMPTEQRKCGIVFQQYALFPNLTVAENIAYGLTGRAWRKAQRQARVAEMLAMVGLSGSEAKYPLQLSGGQQQRVALARALAPEPDLLLLDEPLSALDAQVRQSIRQEIRQLQQRLQIPTILVTHDQEEALTMADRIVVMNHGVVAQVDTPAHIYHRPANRFVAGFVGQMNFFPGMVDEHGRVVIAGCASEQGICLPQVNLLTSMSLELGCRPEAIHLTAPIDEALTLTVRVVSTEFLGSCVRILAELITDPVSVIPVRIEVSHREAAQVLEKRVPLLPIYVAVTDLHVFDATGRAVR